MSEQTTNPDIPAATPTETKEAAFAATLSIHYITMALYTLGFVGTAGNLFLGLIQGESENLLGYIIITLLPIMLFLMHLMAVKGLKKRQAWGYKATRFLGFLMLLGFPFGTVLGLFLLSQLAKFSIDG
jgi:hypothetical protein